MLKELNDRKCFGCNLLILVVIAVTTLFVLALL
jgi:hypothetical protein